MYKSNPLDILKHSTDWAKIEAFFAKTLLIRLLYLLTVVGCWQLNLTIP